jgi:hypothetical protein
MNHIFSNTAKKQNSEKAVLNSQQQFKGLMKLVDYYCNTMEAYMLII